MSLRASKWKAKLPLISWCIYGWASDAFPILITTFVFSTYFIQNIATDRIIVERQPVGFMYRDIPDNAHDSGWRFFAGDESQDYLDNAANLEIYDVNTIANYDSGIVPLLKAAARSKASRSAGG